MSYHFKFNYIYVPCAIILYLTFNTKSQGYCKRVQYFSLERPHLLYYSPELYTNITLKSQRVSRSDPVHYVNLTFNLIKTMNNEYKHSFYFYQLLSNVYKRSFVEIHFGTCDLFQRDNMFSSTLLPAYYRLPVKERVSPLCHCPLIPGYYRFERLKIHSQYIPKNFPFNEGRAYYNLTLKNKLLANGYLDFQLQTN